MKNCLPALMLMEVLDNSHKIIFLFPLLQLWEKKGHAHIRIRLTLLSAVLYTILQAVFHVFPTYCVPYNCIEKECFPKNRNKFDCPRIPEKVRTEDE